MEKWTPIKGFEQLYEISSIGRIKRIPNKHRKSAIVLKTSKDKYGYVRILLTRDGVRLNKFVHRLIAESFLLQDGDQDQVNHKNGVRDDNRLENLEWCTQSENIKHSYDVLSRVNNGGMPRKTVISTCLNTGIEKVYESISEAAKLSNMSRKSVRNCINDSTRSVFGLKWELRDA